VRRGRSVVPDQGAGRALGKIAANGGGRLISCERGRDAGLTRRR